MNHGDAIQINGFENKYYTVPQAAKKLQIATSSMRNFLDKTWLDDHDIEHHREDMLKTPTKRIYVSTDLIDRIHDALWVPVG